MKYTILLFILLTGCNTFSPTYINDEVLIKWVRYDNIGQLEEAVGKAVLGRTFVQLEDKKCTIHALNPRSLDDERTCTLGHEVKHCFDGGYHD